MRKPYDPEIFKGPLMVMRSEFRPDRNSVCGVYAKEGIPFDSTFYGYSGHGHSLGELIVDYLFVLSYSRLLYYTALVTSSSYGVNRDFYTKDDFDRFPLVPLERLSPNATSMISEIAREIRRGDRPWQRVDDWFAGVYRLSKADQQVISDTVEHGMQFGNYGYRSQEGPSREEIARFGATLNQMLSPFFALTEGGVRVAPRNLDSSWVFIDIFADNIETPSSSDDIRRVSHALADNEGASVTKVKIRDGHLMVAIEANRRYWTQSHARTVALDILRQSSDFFPVMSV